MQSILTPSWQSEVDYSNEGIEKNAANTNSGENSVSQVYSGQQSKQLMPKFPISQFIQSACISTPLWQSPLKVGFNTMTMLHITSASTKYN
jgi:hypothetical protein